MARRPAIKPLDIAELTSMIQEGLKAQVARPNLYAYRPHPKQLTFHQSVKHTRLYIGGNRSGKTVGGAVEMAYWLMKKHPYRRLPLPEGPVRARGVAVDFDYGVDVLMLPEIKRWLPPSFLINGSWEDSYDNGKRTLTLANQSFIELRSYAQDLDKHAGASRHCIWFDEEPPKHIYNENMARLIDTDGYTWLTMTPVNGMTWVYEDLYLKGTEGHKDIDVIEIDTSENPHLSKEAIERVYGELDPEERKAREHGEFISVGGKVFKMFNMEAHVVEPWVPPKDWEWYLSLDHGYNNPTAVLWHAVSRDNQVVTFAEHYLAEMTVPEHAKAIHEKNKALGHLPDYWIGDPAINQRQGVTGTSIKQEYADRGIYLADGNNDVMSGINRMAQYLKPNSKGVPRWTITANCTNLITEMKKLRWDTYASRKMQFENNRKEKIHKKDDHACDSARYFFSFMPDLTPEGSVEPTMAELSNLHAPIIGAVTPESPTAGRWDELASQLRKPSGTNWDIDYGYDGF
jgi:phage terminase large subunit-like protein